MFRIDRDPDGAELLTGAGGDGVRTGNNEVFFQEDLCKSAHAGAADPDKVNMAGTGKINLIHIRAFFP